MIAVKAVERGDEICFEGNPLLVSILRNEQIQFKIHQELVHVNARFATACVKRHYLKYLPCKFQNGHLVCL